jgi:hypothetical protein
MEISVFQRPKACKAIEDPKKRVWQGIIFGQVMSKVKGANFNPFDTNPLFGFGWWHGYR